MRHDGVKALNSDRNALNALEKKAGLSVVSWNRRYLFIYFYAAQLRKESDRWL